MQCNVCGFPGSRCRENFTRCSYLYTHLDNNYLNSLQLNEMVGKLFIALDPDKEEYVFQLNKGMYKTHIFGKGYQKFVSNYSLNDGDRVRVELDHPALYFHIKAEGGPMYPEQSDDDTEDSVLNYEDSVPVFTNGLELTDEQRAVMNNFVTTRGIGLGPILVHKLTESDVCHNGLNIPKRVVSALNINKKGWSVLRFGDTDEWREAAISRSTDGRMRLGKGWPEFVNDFKLEEGLIVLMLFYRDDHKFLNITFDVL